ncbi:hypothetical protein J6590_017251 [Homalodisca vitripennis]|nr:hypothetical protein J6590_017251 [Homalodisca vitripennis]
MSLFGFESLSLRRDVMEQMFLRGLVQGRVDSGEGLGVISFRVPSFNSGGRLLFELPHVRTVAHASSPLLRMNQEPEARCDISIIMPCLHWVLQSSAIIFPRSGTSRSGGWRTERPPNDSRAFYEDIGSSV